MERPVGVSVIAVLYFIAAAGLAVVALVLLLGAGALSRMMTQQPGMGPLMMGAGAIGAVVAAIIAACAVAVGWGLWSLRNWARIVAIVLSALAVAANLPGLFFLSGMHAGYFFLGLGAIRIVVNLVIIWYLLQREVGQAFGAAG